MGLRFPFSFFNLKDPVIINRLFALLCFVYILSPLLFFVPASDFEDQVIWTAWEGRFFGDGPSARRGFVQALLVYFANIFHVSPWMIWQIFLTALTPLCMWLTYLFVRHFRKIGALEFALFTLAAPYWVIHLQYPSDTTFAYPAVIASLYLSTKNRWWLPLAAVMALLAFKLRPDAIAMAGVVALTIWVDRKNLRDRLIDCAVFISVFAIAFMLLLGYFNSSLPVFIDTALNTVNIDWPETYLGMDIFLKVFTVNAVLVLPFYLLKIYRDFRQDGPVKAFWVLVPILIYTYFYRNLMVEPRWFVYVAPFVMITLIDGATPAITYLKKFRLFRRRFVIPALIGILLFNPFLHIATLGASEHQPNIVSRISKSYDRLIFSYLHTGLLPALNLIYKANYYNCYTHTDRMVKAFLASPYPASVIFVIGGDGENVAHHRVLEAYYSYFGIPYTPDTTGKNLVVKRRTFLMEFWKYGQKSKPGQRIERFTYQGKTLVLIKNRGPLLTNSDLPVVEAETLDVYLKNPNNSDPKFAPDDFFKAMSINISIPQYPKYLGRNSFCLINDRSPDIIPRVAAAAEATAKAILLTPDGKKQQRYLNRQKILLQKNKEAHERWLAENPEYEKRLYDRVKDINKRTVKLTRTLVWGFILILVVLSALVIIVVRRSSLNTIISLLSDRHRQGDEKMTPTSPSKDSSEDLYRHIRLKIQLFSIARRQKRLEAMCDRIEDRLQTAGDEKQSLEALLKQIREELNEIAQERQAVAPPRSLT